MRAANRLANRRMDISSGCMEGNPSAEARVRLERLCLERP
jgi:hypothetical protein